jgi:hypothetical protein
MISHTTTNGDETRAESDDAMTMLHADHATMRRLSNAGAPSAEPGLVAI